MSRQPLSRADTGDNSRGVELRPLTARGLLKLLAWPVFFYGVGLVLFLAMYALQLGGFL